METMNKLKKHFLIAATTLTVFTVNAREKQGMGFKNSVTQKVAAGCSAPQSSAELSVNNVRVIIFSGSDMWWDLFGSGNAWYVVPKVEEKSKWINSSFAGNVWFGGLDAGGQLKIAAQTYRQGGIDFWTGPLSTIDASVNQDVCSKYDKIFRITRSDVDEFVLSGGKISDEIKNWPGNGDLSYNQDPYLAPWVDKNGVPGDQSDGSYDPEQGDYPYYDVKNNLGKDNLGVCKARIFGDETLWWVYNDNGDVHTATGGQSIGMEVRAQAFAFKTTNEINNMTFYSYQIINRSFSELNNTYMTVWTDADLGNYADDYIGCDVKRGLGYIYNADNFDDTQGGVNGYGSFIPALGCDFFQGPINTRDGIDNDNDGLIDSQDPGEQMGMTKFLYFNNSLPGIPLQKTDPQNATQYYQYMTGFWRDGTPFTCGGDGYGGSIPTSFVYPADSYTNGPCGNWQEGASPGSDRRFMQSSGPFFLEPGAVNFVTIGMPWARTTSTDPKASIPLLKIADDKAQALFDDCFKILSGPEAPDMTIQEMNNELILYFTNKVSSNNYLNNYKELDVLILVDTLTPTFAAASPSNTPFNNVDRYYQFEGFKVYQLRNEGITQEELVDPSKAKLAFSCDINNGVKRLINYEFDPTTGGDIPKVKAEGLDNGISSTFHFTKDLFSSSVDQKVINNKTYYFLTVAYAYNEYAKYKEDQPLLSQNAPSSLGQKLTYLEGRKSKKAYGIPHIPDPEKNGTASNSFYGYGPKVTRIEGQGNGGNILDLTQSSIDAIVNSGGRVNQITYENGAGPINVKVVDPLNIPNSEFAVIFTKKNYYSITDSAKKYACSYNVQNKVSVRNTLHGNLMGDSVTWILKDLTTGKEYSPCKSIKVFEEFYFSELGLSVKIGQPTDIAPVSSPVNIESDKVVRKEDFLQATLAFSDPTKTWLSGFADREGTDGFNWIRSGGYAGNPDANQNDYIANGGSGFLDPNQVFENVLGGTWAPYCLAAATKTGVGAAAVNAAPAFSSLFTGVAAVPGDASTAKLASPYDLRILASVDVVFTADKSKWTRCLVLEECDDQIANPTGAKKLEPKRRRSVDKQGVPNNIAGCNLSEAIIDTINYGLSWFPGYAINIETGERLNIAFGEDSYQTGNNGNDMMWNPTSVTSETGYRYALGGRHYIYIFGHNRSDTKYAGVASVGGKTIDNRVLGVGTYNDFLDLATTYKWAYSNSNNNTRVIDNIWSEALWVNIPMLSETRFAFNNPANIPCDAKVRLRVKKPYKTRFSGTIKVNSSIHLTAGFTAPIISASSPFVYNNLSSDSTLIGFNSINNNMGYYRFNTADIFSEVNKADKEKSALDLINVVPNPYYAYSTYEERRLDNRIRITNLPNKCKIKIFTLNGTLVRTFDRDVTGQEDLNIVTPGNDFVHSKRLPFQDWDLKNQSGISVASGLYIIHVDVPGVGEKILKWFGVMRPLDLQNY